MSSQKHLLVIRLSAMGDVAMCVPVISALLNQHPGVRITVLTREFLAPLFSELTNVDVCVADVKGKHSGPFGLWKLYKELKPLQIDAIADLHNVLRSNVLKIYFKFGGYRFVQIDKGRAEKKALTSFRNKVFRPLKTTHQRYADVFSKLGFPLRLKATPCIPRRQLSNTSHAFMANENRKYIGIAPFAAFEGKTYPSDLMEEVIAHLSNSYSILLFGGGDKEKSQLENWENRFPNTSSIIDKLTFEEELQLISNLDIMLAMDSGNAHLAALYGVPTVTIWGVTHPYAGFFPFGQEIQNALLADRNKFPMIPTSVYGNTMPEGYSQAIRTITPKAVIEKIRGLLEKIEKTPRKKPV